MKKTFSNIFQVSYLIVDEAMTELEMKPDPFLLHGKSEKMTTFFKSRLKTMETS